jgi:peptide/nickel transport system substrate-binding protein
VVNACRRSIALAVSLLALGGVAAEALAQKAGGVLRVAHRENPPSASPHEEATIATMMPFSAIFNNLISFDPASKQNVPDRIVPELATEWRWNEDQTRLTFKLREGVKFHDGKPFTSADVKCTWDMVSGKTDAKMRKNPRLPWYFNLQEITTSGPQEVTFHLGRPQPSFLSFLAGHFSAVYPCHVGAAQMRTKPIGTGPFKFVEFKQNESMKLTRNREYWKPGLPYLDGIEFTIVVNRSTSMLAFTSGKFDLTFTTEVSVPLMKDVKAQMPSAVCEMLPTNTQANVLINRERPPFDDARVRRAMVLALDRKAFVDILGEGVFQSGGAMLPPPGGIWGMSPEFLQTVAGYNPDVERSREEGRKIMAEAGYGPEKPLRIKVSTRNVASFRDPAVILIDHLKRVHIEAELEVLDTPVWYTRLTRKDFQVGMNVQGVGIDDPDVVFFETFGCKSERNYTSYCNPEIEKLFDAQSREFDNAKRKLMVWNIDKALQEDGARPVIYHGQAGTCWSPAVKGINMASNSIYNHWRFEDVWLDR